MKEILYITIIGFFIGIVGTGLGGIFSFFIRENKKSLSFFLGLTGGLMLQIVTFHLLPEAIILSNSFIVVFGVVLGVILIYGIEMYISSHSFSTFEQSGLLLGISIAIHNLPEGLALGSSFIMDRYLGLFLSLAILLHNLPEGIALAMPLKINKTSKGKILLYTCLAGIPIGIGTLVGAYLGTISNHIISFCLSLAGGTMFYIIVDDIMPNAKTLHDGRVSTVGTILGFLLGILFSY